MRCIKINSEIIDEKKCEITIDDVIEDIKNCAYERINKHFNDIIPMSKQWFQNRQNKITGSAIGSYLNLNPYKMALDVILNQKLKPKVPLFIDNCYRGLKYESVIRSIYQVKN